VDAGILLKIGRFAAYGPDVDQLRVRSWSPQVAVLAANSLRSREPMSQAEATCRDEQRSVTVNREQSTCRGMRMAPAKSGQLPMGRISKLVFC
jgi:hypothetical protein